MREWFYKQIPSSRDTTCDNFTAPGESETLECVCKRDV